MLAAGAFIERLLTGVNGVRLPVPTIRAHKTIGPLQVEQIFLTGFFGGLKPKEKSLLFLLRYIEAGDTIFNYIPSHPYLLRFTHTLFKASMRTYILIIPNISSHIKRIFLQYVEIRFNLLFLTEGDNTRKGTKKALDDCND
jgi:hypothetical protein